MFPSHDTDVDFDFDCPFEDIVASDPLSNFQMNLGLLTLVLFLLFLLPVQPFLILLVEKHLQVSYLCYQIVVLFMI